MLVRHDLALQFGRRVVAVVAGGAILLGVIDKAVRQDALHAAARDLAGREGVVLDHGRRLAQHHRDLVRDDRATIERAEFAVLPLRRRRADAMAEIVLAACVELYVGRKHAAIFVEEADQAAVVVDVPVADDQRLDLARIDLQQAHVVDDRRRRVAEVQQDRALVLVALRFEVERQTPFVVQHVARIGAAPGPGPSWTTPLTVLPRRNWSCCWSTSTRMESLSTVGTWIGAAEANLDAGEACRCSAGKRRRGFEEVTTVEQRLHGKAPAGRATNLSYIKYAADQRRNCAANAACPRRRGDRIGTAMSARDADMDVPKGFSRYSERRVSVVADGQNERLAQLATGLIGRSPSFS